MNELIRERHASFDPRFFVHAAPEGASQEATDALRSHLLERADKLLGRASALAAHRNRCTTEEFRKRKPMLESGDVGTAADSMNIH